VVLCRHESCTRQNAASAVDFASIKKHDAMGFQVGWGTVLEQPVEHVKKARVS